MKRTIAAILATALAAASAPGATAAEKPEAITVAYFPEWPTANQVAQAERWYDEEMGLEVKWRPFDSGVQMADAMVAGEVDISYSMGIIPFMRAVSGGAPLTTVGIAVSYAENDNCVVHYKAAIDKANAHELEGKKIAVPFGTVTHYKLLRTLDFLAVDTGKLDLVDMVSVKGAEALARGEVTMACGWGGALRRMLGKNRVLMSAREQTKIGIRTFDVVAVTNDFADCASGSGDRVPEGVGSRGGLPGRSPGRGGTGHRRGAGLSLKESNILLSRSSFYTPRRQLTGTWIGGRGAGVHQGGGGFLCRAGRHARGARRLRADVRRRLL